MIRPLQPLLNAIQFMTIVPTPGAERLDDDWLLSAAEYFPLVGALIGLVSAAVLLAGSAIWTGIVPAVLAILTGTILTGALHEDGIADTADGLFGGRTREQRLLIIKDSRIGTYGAIALVSSLVLRIALLASLPGWLGAAALVAAHSLGRSGILLTMSAIPYAGNVATAKLNYPTTRIDRIDRMWASAFTVLGVLWLATTDVWAAGCGLAVAVALGVLPPLAARRLLGGYTGDVLGATEQMIEIGLLLGVAAAVGHGTI